MLDYNDYCDRRDAEEWEEFCKNRPVCVNCEETIQEDVAVCICGDWYCDSCIDLMRKTVEVDGI